MPENLTAVILAGGHGECLRVGEEYVPKLLLPVTGRPLLEHQLEWLKRTGIRSAVLCLDYKPEQVRAHIGDGSRFDMRLRYSVEESPRGTAGAVKALGTASLSDDVLILLGGVYPDTDCAKMVLFHRSHQALATLALHECVRGPARQRNAQGRAVPCDKMHACDGEPVVLGPAHRIVDFPRYHPEARPGPEVSPLWIIRRALLRFVPEGAASDFVRDVFPAAVKAGEALMGYRETGTLADLGSPDRYELFAKSVARKKVA
jgi:NDP-sugar pyrophosphorylase family protein